MQRILLALATLALLAISPLAASPTAFDDGDDIEGPRCPGCTKSQNGPNYSTNGAANTCNSDLRVTLMGTNGKCETNAAGDCLKKYPCRFNFMVEYRSACDVNVLYDLNGHSSSTDFPASPGMWATAFPMTQVNMECGTPMSALTVVLSDADGFVKMATAQASCNPCD